MELERQSTSSSDLENWNAGERGARIERAFPMLLRHLNSGCLSRRLQRALQKFMMEQDVSWMSEDLSFLSTHTVCLSDCGESRSVNAYVVGYQSNYFRGVFKYTQATSIDIKLEGLESLAPSIVTAIDGMDLSGCHTEITDENCLKLFIAADFIMCEQLRSLCLQFIARRAVEDCQTALAVWNCARTLHLPELTLASTKSTLKGFTELRLTAEFLDLDGNAMKELLGHRMLNCYSELQVLETIHKWLHHNAARLQPSQKTALEQLFCCVRVSQMQPEQLVAAQALPIAKACDDFLEHLGTYPRPSSFSARHLVALRRHNGPRRPHQVIMILQCRPVAMGATQRGPLATCLFFDHRADAFNRCPPDGRTVPDVVDPRLRSEVIWPAEVGQTNRVCCLARGDFIYLVGGWWCAGPQRVVLRCDRSQPVPKWAEHSVMTQARDNHCCAIVGGFLYAVGGRQAANILLSTAERMAASGDSNLWSAIDKMRTIRSEAACVEHRGKLLVVGGFDGKQYLDTAEVFCPTDGAWTLVSGCMSQRRGGLGLVVCGGAVFALCGRNASGWRRSVERWEEGRSWKGHCKIARHRSNFGYATVDNRIYLFGGVDSAGLVPTTEWIEPLQPRPTRGLGHAVPLTGESFATCLLEVDLNDAIGQ